MLTAEKVGLTKLTDKRNPVKVYVPAEFIARTTYEEEPILVVPVGEPEMAPVEVLKLKPVGRAGVIDHDVGGLPVVALPVV